MIVVKAKKAMIVIAMSSDLMLCLSVPLNDEAPTGGECGGFVLR
jgi:hypothetical protein